MTKTFLERLDDSVRWTGIPALAERGVRRRHRRWLPIAALVWSTAGLLFSLLRPDIFWVGYAFLITGSSIGNFGPMFGPLIPFMSPEPIDERQRSERSDAYLVAFTVIGMVAFVGMLVLAAVTVLQDWPRDLLVKEMIALALYLFALLTTLPTLYASWKTRPIPDE
jgi:hypothetical protein